MGPATPLLLISADPSADRDVNPSAWLKCRQGCGNFPTDLCPALGSGCGASQRGRRSSLRLGLVESKGDFLIENKIEAKLIGIFASCDCPGDRVARH